MEKRKNMLIEPCICGNSPALGDWVERRVDRHTSRHISVECETCGKSGKRKGSKKAAIAAWNR
jgi:hypothetical protein